MNKCSTTIQHLNKKVSLLTYTEGMSCWSFSLPAGKNGSCVYEFAETKDSICHGCYAQINRYNMPNVLSAQWVRFLWVQDCLKNNPVTFIDTMVNAIRLHTHNKGYFRVHDSGDFFSPEYIKAWHVICESLPKIKFWFPTRVWRSKSKTWLTPLAKLAALSNVQIRPSGLKINDLPPEYDWLSKGTTVIDSVDRHNLVDSICPKTVNGGSCETNKCRTCWSDKKSVAYLVHGYLGRAVMPNAKTEKIINTRNTIASLTIKGLTYQKG